MGLKRYDDKRMQPKIRKRCVAHQAGGFLLRWFPGEVVETRFSTPPTLSSYARSCCFVVAISHQLPALSKHMELHVNVDAQILCPLSSFLWLSHRSSFCYLLPVLRLRVSHAQIILGFNTVSDSLGRVKKLPIEKMMDVDLEVEMVLHPNGHLHAVAVLNILAEYTECGIPKLW